jgi:uncharacterized coiled-coil protein SlyX
MKKLVEWEEMPSCKMPTLSEDGESLIVHGPPLIEWDEPRPAWRVRLTVETDKPKYLARGATVEDLRKACEVMGLHVVTPADANMHNPVRAALDPGSTVGNVDLVTLARNVRKSLEVECTRRAAAEAEVATLREEAKSNTDILSAVKAALDPNGMSFCDIVTLASAFVVSREAAIAGRDAAMEAFSKAEMEASGQKAENTLRLSEVNKENDDLRKDVERLRQDAMRLLIKSDEVCVALDPEWEGGRVEALDLARKAFSEISDLKGQVAQVSLLQHRKMELESDNAVQSSRISSLEALLETTFEEAAKLKGKLDNLPSASVPVTDEELDRMARDAYRLRSRDPVTIAEMRNLARDVAERVTACFKCDLTKCLVERLVEAKTDFEAQEDVTGKWVIKAHTSGQLMQTQHDVPSADVPTVLAKLAKLEGEK